MSLVVAVHNARDIVIAWDKQSRYSQVGRAFAPLEEVEKASKIHDQLALMVTGSYNSDKIALLAGFKQRQAQAPLDEAFKDLYEIGNKMVLQPDERGIMIGLAGYIAGEPAFRFVQRAYGDPDLTYVMDYPINYYLSGDEAAGRTAEARLESEGLTAPRPTAEITDKLSGIVGHCIELYPEVLNGPVQTLTLTKA
jgi:hypothetical protein